MNLSFVFLTYMNELIGLIGLIDLKAPVFIVLSLINSLLEY